MRQESPRPDEPDVHLSIQFHDIRMEFAACRTAAELFVREWRARHYHHAVTVLSDDPTGLPRLPNERLFLQP